MLPLVSEFTLLLKNNPKEGKSEILGVIVTLSNVNLQITLPDGMYVKLHHSAVPLLT